MNLDYKNGNFRFNARAAALIYNKDKTKLLIFKIEDGRDFYMLPGGRIEEFEDSFHAIKREIKEELGFDLDYKLISIQENFVNINDQKIMQYCFCYESIYYDDIIDLKIKCKDKEGQYFYWVDISDVSNFKILPKSTYKLINSKDIRHFIER